MFLCFTYMFPRTKNKTKQISQDPATNTPKDEIQIPANKSSRRGGKAEQGKEQQLEPCPPPQGPGKVLEDEPCTRARAALWEIRTKAVGLGRSLSVTAFPTSKSSKKRNEFNIFWIILNNFK